MEDPEIGKDLLVPASYFFLDQFCRGMYCASGNDANKIAKLCACRDASDFEDETIITTGNGFEELGFAVYSRLADRNSSLLFMTDAAEYMAQKLGRTDYWPHAVELILKVRGAN